MTTFLISCLLQFQIKACAQGLPVITNYAFVEKLCFHDKSYKKLEYAVAIRQFIKDGNNYFLVIDPVTLKSAIITADHSTCLDKNNLSSKFNIQQVEAITDDFKRSPYNRLLTYTKSYPPKQQSGYQHNAGIGRSLSNKQGCLLTFDLCPTKKKIDKEVFQAVVDYTIKERFAGVPMVIAISGDWMAQHPEDLGWLKKTAKTHNLDITWANHSNTHPYNPKKNMEGNFLLSPGVNLDEEISKTEIRMLENNLLPSAFFRFPGLVSNQQQLEKIRERNLIPLGSNAWLGFGPNIKASPGDIILVHGNGNENSQGKQKFFDLINKKGFRVISPAELTDEPALRYNNELP